MDSEAIETVEMANCCCLNVLCIQSICFGSPDSAGCHCVDIIQISVQY